MDANKDGLNSKAEVAAAKAAIAAAAAAKQTAADAVADLPAGVSKTAFEDRLEALDGTNPPTVSTLNAPTGKDQLVTTNEDVAKAFSASDFSTGFADADGNDFAGIVIGNLSSHGSLTLNGVAVTAGQEIAASQLNQLQFTANAHYSGQDSFTFFVKDSGNILDFADGSKNQAESSNTMNIITNKP